jgi:hypothetical protein
MHVVVLARVHGQPISAILVLVEPAVARIVDDEIVIRLEGSSVLRQRSENLSARCVEQVRDLVAILGSQDFADGPRIIDRCLEFGQMWVLVIPNDQCVIVAEAKVISDTAALVFWRREPEPTPVSVGELPRPARRSSTLAS